MLPTTTSGRGADGYEPIPSNPVHPARRSTTAAVLLEVENRSNESGVASATTTGMLELEEDEATLLVSSPHALLRQHEAYGTTRTTLIQQNQSDNSRNTHGNNVQQHQERSIVNSTIEVGGDNTTSNFEEAGGTAATNVARPLPQSSSSPLPTAAPNGNASTTNTPSATTTNSNRINSTDGTMSEPVAAVLLLTRRLRCLFGIITWPIVPLGTIVTMALVYVLYIAIFSSDYSHDCSHPLKAYTILSFLLLLYAPNHGRVRSFLFAYVRERDGPTRPPLVRRYDQIFHTLALLYVYAGITLIQSCREDISTNLILSEMRDDSNNNNMINNMNITKNSTTSMPGSTRLEWLQSDGIGNGDGNTVNSNSSNQNTCIATCPHLFHALSVYVTTLELFMFSLIVPLLFLPCIYLWFLRQVTSDQETLSALQERLREEEESLLLGTADISSDDILNQEMQPIQLITIATTTNNSSTVWMVDRDSTDQREAKEYTGARECCICMCEFGIIDEHQPQQIQGQSLLDDIESGSGERVRPLHLEDQNIFHTVARTVEITTPVPTNSDHDDQQQQQQQQLTEIVRTKKCGHLFHQHCIASWLGGQWQPNSNGASSSRNGSWVRRRARRTSCPLCRQDLRPATS